MVRVAVVIIVFSSAARAADSLPFPLFYHGQESLVLDRLRLDPSTVDAADLAGARTAVVQDELPAPGPELDALKARVRSGMGLLLILGSHTSADSIASLTGGAAEQTATIEAKPGMDREQELERIAAVILYVGPEADRLGTEISWRSAVRIKERSILKVNQGEVLAATSGRDDPISPHAPILIRLRIGQGTVFILTAWLKQGEQAVRERSYLAMLSGIEGAYNYDLQRWAYFNWLIYYMTRDAGGVTPVAYGSWIAAPVPDRHQVHLLAVIFFTMFAFLLSAFIISRRYSMRHPEKLGQFYLHSTASDLPLAAAAEEPKPDHGDPRWEIVGFHRPLNGLLYNYLLSLFIMIPLAFAVTFYLERNFVNPFLEARGAWAAVTQFMLIFFTLLDVGTSQAMVKYFAEFRVGEPTRAVQYAQFFIWFHALAGIVQITALGLATAIWLPHTAAAFLTWMIVLHSLIQFPGFITIFFNLFRALQRFDYSQLLIVLIYVLNPILQMLCGTYMRRWGLLHPAFGEGLGVVFGFAIGGFLANLLMGAFCAYFYHAVGFKLTTIFLAHFNRDTVKRSFTYGVKLAGGQALGALSWGVVPLMMLILLPNAIELNEIFILTVTFTFAYTETGAYIFTTLMPTVSESSSHHKVALTRRYLDQGLRWGIIVATMLGGAFLAFTQPFLAGLLPAQFARSLEVIALAHLWRVADFATRLPDQVFQAMGRTGLFTWVSLIENSSRMVLAWYLIIHYGFKGVFYAFIISSALKALFAWPLMIRLLVSPAISLWQTFINPALAAAGNYLLLSAVADLIWRGPGYVATAWVAVLVCLFGSLPVYMFLSGLLGWDSAALAEFQDAAELVPPPFGVLARFAYRVVLAGTALSPLQNRFPGRLTEVALAEAQVLTASKAELR